MTNINQLLYNRTTKTHIAKFQQIVHHYDIQCRFGFVGNPFEGCTPSSPLSGQTEREDLCRDTQCGPNAICNAGQCLCAPGFKVRIEIESIENV